MRLFRTVLVPLLVIGSSFTHAQSAPDKCQNTDTLICAPTNPEDLLLIPGTPWVMVSNMVNAGYLYASNVNDLSSDIVFPTSTSKQVHNKKLFPNCPGPLSSEFRPHGLALREGDKGVHTLYVIGHGKREAVEVFSLDTNQQSAKLTWVGCAIAPEGVSLNSVAPLPNGAFAATNFNLDDGGEVWEWQLNDGWSKVPGSDMFGPNGLITSDDGQWFYIGGWQDEALIRLSRGKQPVEKEMLKVGFHIDNVRWGKDGTILVAGQKGSRADIRACLYQGNCEKASTGVALIDEKSMQVLASQEIPSDENFILGTVAIQVNNDTWVGGIANGRYISRFRFND